MAGIPKLEYGLIALIPMCLFLITVVVVILVWITHCNLLASECDQSAKMTVYIAVIVAGIATATATIVEGIFYHLQSRQSDKHYQRQMRAIKRLEEKIDRIWKGVA